LGQFSWIWRINSQVMAVVWSSPDIGARTHVARHARAQDREPDCCRRG
jgi:hypothetical protein